MALNLKSLATGFEYPVVLPLAKFSFTTTSSRNPTAPANWTHLPDRDVLTVIFDRVRIRASSGQVEDKGTLRVVKSATTMEDLDLQSLAREAQAEMQDSQSRGTQSTQEETRHRRVMVLVRLPSIAFRYPLHNDSSRRFQMRFQNDPDYYKALTILSDVGFPLMHANTPPTVNRLLPSSSTVGQLSSGSQTFCIASESSVRKHPSMNESDGPVRRPDLPVFNNCDMRHNASTTLPPTIFSQRVFSSQMEQASSLSEGQVSSPFHVFAASQPPSQLPLAEKSEGQAQQLSQSQEPLTGTDASQSISQWLPPRVLPFPNPSLRPESRSKAPGSPTKQVTQLPSTPKPATSIAKKKQGGRPKAKVKQTPCVPTVEDALLMPSRCSKGNRPAESLEHTSVNEMRELTGVGTSFTSSHKRRGLNGEADDTSSRAQQEQEVFGGVQPEGETASATLSAMSQEVQNIVPVLNTESLNTRCPTLQQTDTILSSIEGGLRGYASRSMEERHLMTEEWMCGLIVDDDFKALCEDVDANWKRVFYGQ